MIGNNGTATVGNNDTVTLNGTNNWVSMGDGGSAFISGPDETIAIDAAGGRQTISGFSLDQSDRLDLTQILAGVSLTHDLSNLGDFVSVSRVAADTILTITGMSESDTVTLHGLGSLSLVQLMAHNMLVMGT
jgi:hypothetical protein